MQQFERNQNVLAGKEARRIIRLYNKIAQTLVTFELRWHEAWVANVERAKSGECVFDEGGSGGVLIMHAFVCAVHRLRTQTSPSIHTSNA